MLWWQFGLTDEQKRKLAMRDAGWIQCAACGRKFPTILDYDNHLDNGGCKVERD